MLECFLDRHGPIGLEETRVDFHAAATAQLGGGFGTADRLMDMFLAVGALDVNRDAVEDGIHAKSPPSAEASQLTEFN